MDGKEVRAKALEVAAILATRFVTEKTEKEIDENGLLNRVFGMSSKIEDYINKAKP